MSVNKYLPHVLVLPEDDANRQMANGFLLDPSLLLRRIQVLEVAGGWLEVLDRFRCDHIPRMNDYPDRLMVLLIDLDGKEGRTQEAKREIPEQLRDRVFILSTLTEPEDIEGPYEEIGKAMARDCREGTNGIWDHELLRHNSAELERLRERVRPILFDG